MLEDDTLLSDCGIKPNSDLHYMNRQASIEGLYQRYFAKATGDSWKRPAPGFNLEVRCRESSCYNVKTYLHGGFSAFNKLEHFNNDLVRCGNCGSRRLYGFATVSPGCYYRVAYQVTLGDPIVHGWWRLNHDGNPLRLSANLESESLNRFSQVIVFVEPQSLKVDSKV